jgi:Leucine-rich repeat (LRR) protein
MIFFVRQILDLSYNHLEVLQFGQFSGLSGLRIIVLSHNRLRSLPRDVFQSTSIESVDLSSNEFVAMPTSALTEVSANLRHLNLSNNAIEHLDSTMFSNMPHLLSLSFAHNRLTVLPDNIFIGIGGLRTLDLSSNPLRVNFKSLCHFVRRLNSLRLSGVELETLPTLQLPQLTKLDVSDNRLSDISQVSVEGMPKLRHLNLSKNKFLRLPCNLSFIVLKAKQELFIFDNT